MVQNVNSSGTLCKSLTWDHLLVVLLVAINLNLWWTTKQGSASPTPNTDAEHKPLKDIETILKIMGRLDNFAWWCTPLWIVLPFASGYLLAKFGCCWPGKPFSETTAGTKMEVDITCETIPEDADENAHGASSGTGETGTSHPHGKHDVRHFKKATTPSSTGTQTIVSELAQFVFTDGKYRGLTFEEVCIIDHDKSYKKRLQTRLHQFDIAYSAFVLYSDLRAIVQR